MALQTKLHTPGMALDEFIRLYDQDGAFELIDGERIARTPQVTRHTLSQRAMFVALHSHVTPRGLGEVFVEATFILSDKSTWVKGSRIPDVLFVSVERMAAFKARTPNWKDKPLILIPDLTVEIVSENDMFTDVNKKVSIYLQDGVRLIWIVDPHQQNVTVYHQGSKQITLLSIGDTLEGGDVLPEFKLPVVDLFPD